MTPRPTLIALPGGNSLDALAAKAKPS